MVTSGSTVLSSESTAVALVRLALGAGPIGAPGLELDTAIRTTEGFPGLVDAIDGALLAGVPPSVTSGVLDSVSSVVASTSVSMASAKSTATRAVDQSIKTPAADGVPYVLIKDTTLTGSRQVLLTQGFFNGGVEIQNQMPIPWLVSSYTAYSDEAESQIDRAVVPGIEVFSFANGVQSLRASNEGFNLRVGQNLSTRFEMGTSIFVGILDLGLTMVPAPNCVASALRARDDKDGAIRQAHWQVAHLVSLPVIHDPHRDRERWP